MGLVEEFGKNPHKFFRDHPIHVHEDCDTELPQGVQRFSLVGTGSSVVELHPYNGKGKGIKAYWLPWAPKGATSMELRKEQAHIFFTSELTGCRFTVHDFGDGHVKVAHLAGNIEVPRPVGKPAGGSVGRDRAEAEIFGGRDAARRRLTCGNLRREDLNTQSYGQNWAFVVGNYTDETGWKFIAQVNTGVGKDPKAFKECLVI